MNERDIAKEAILAWLKSYQSRSDEDYDFNPDKVDKMNEILALCQSLEHMYANCNIVRVELTPKYVQGSVELLLEGEWEIGQPDETIEGFRRIVSLCDGVNIEPFGEDFFHITFFVEDLYLRTEA